MGRPKLLLPIHGRTVIERLIDAAHAGGVAQVVVIVRPDDAELADVARNAGAAVVRLAGETAEMRDTVVAGLDWLDPRRPPGFFLLPADHPVLCPRVFAALVDVAAPIVTPTHAGRRGHPVWFDWSLVPAIRSLPAGQGLNALVRAVGATVLPWPTDDVLIDLDTPDDYDRLVRRLADSPVCFTANGEPTSATRRPEALLPGSFNPVHHGHWGLRETAAEILGREVAFELSRVNVDKPELSDDDVARRAVPFRGRADLWVTRAARFLEKARLFPGTVFVVGADTAARIVDVRYHNGDVERLAATLEELRSHGCRFLVAGRQTGGRLLELDAIAVPPVWRPMFDAIPTSRFRLDVSSTELRGGG